MKILAAGDKVTDVPSRQPKLKILAAGDIHGDMGAATKLAEKAEKENVDLVILSGDLTYGEMHSIGIIGPFKKRNKKVVIIPGNHESIATADFLATLYDVKNIHGYSIRMEDVGIFGAGLANVGIVGVTQPATEEDIMKSLKSGFEGIKDMGTKVMVTHVHPDGTLMGKLGYFPGSKAVRRFIELTQPDIAICSHVHEAEGIEESIGATKVINVGKEGKIIEI